MKKIVFFLFFTFLTQSAFCWQQVVVEEPWDEESRISLIRENALHSGFRQAVSQEVERILPGWLSHERKSALMRHLDDRIESLVLSYRRTAETEGSDALVLEMEVSVDVESLRRMLQGAGVYYTSSSLWPYDLNTRGVSPEDFVLLQELQLVTGAVVDGNAPTSLALTRTGDGLWMGRIAHNAMEISGSGKELDRVWFDLWSDFFSRSDIRSALVKSVELMTWGWPTTDSLMHFDMVLESWTREVEYRKITSVQADPGSLKAVWIIRSLAPDQLSKRLHDYLRARGIDFDTKP